MVEVHPHLRSLAYRRDGAFLACAPGLARVRPDGVAERITARSGSGRSAAAATVAALLPTAVALAVFPYVDARSPLLLVVILLVALTAGYAAGSSVYLSLEAKRLRELEEPSLWVGADDRLGSALCAEMWRIASTGAWRAGEIDPHRCAHLHWTALQRTARLAEQESDLERARTYPGLEGEVRDGDRWARSENAELAAVLTNFTEIRRNLEKIDRDRAEGRRRAAEAEHRRREEAELRARLRGSLSDPVPTPAAEQADLSAGLAAESAEIARSVERIEWILNDGGSG